MSLTALAARLGRPKQTVSQWERGEVRVPNDILDTWAGLLGYAVSMVVRPVGDGAGIDDATLTDAQRALLSTVWRHLHGLTDRDAGVLAEVIRMTVERTKG